MRENCPFSVNRRLFLIGFVVVAGLFPSSHWERRGNTPRTGRWVFRGHTVFTHTLTPRNYLVSNHYGHVFRRFIKPNTVLKQLLVFSHHQLRSLSRCFAPSIAHTCCAVCDSCTLNQNNKKGFFRIYLQ